MNMIGKGGFASVYRAKSKKNGLEVAIKMVNIQYYYCFAFEGFKTIF